ERVRFRPIRLKPVREKKPSGRSKVGGLPGWLHEDKNPGLYKGRPMTFRMQWERDTKFPVVPGLPSQFLPPDEPTDPNDSDYYEMFLGQLILFFGNCVDGQYNIYAYPEHD